ncbi:MAG: type II secretion system secretin GspD [Campylobacterales bacterium]
MKLLIKIVLIFCLSSASLLKANDEETVKLNFVNTPLSSLTKMISEVTGLNFVSTDDIPGNFTFVSQKPIKKENLLDIYEMILRTKGYMIVNYEDKGFFMIVKNNDALKQDIPFGDNQESAMPEDNLQMSTELIDLKYFKPTEINKIITPFLSPYGKINANDELGYLLVTDYNDGIDKIKTMVKKIDKQKDVELNWVKMDYVNVSKVFPQIKEVTAKLSEKYRKPINVYADATSNSVIIAASEDDHLEVQEMIKKIDLDNKISKRAEVIYLKNSKAEEVVKILQDIEKTRNETGEKGDSQKAAISMDKSLNAIIVLAEEGEVETYRSIILNLDKPRKQVFVKANIVEINENKASNMGIELDNIFGGGANAGGGWAVEGRINTAPGIGGAPAIDTLRKLGIDYAAINNGFAIGAVINALKQNGIAKTLSTPTILCLDNQESSIYVGQNVPTKTSTSQQKNTEDVPVTSFEYRDIGLTLTVKPQVMNDNKVRLDVFTNLEEVLSDTDNLPKTTKREVTSTSIVNDGADVVIAGLMKTLNHNSESKVPLLGDLPFLGPIFTHEVTRNERINLIIVLTPFVVEEGRGLNSISEKVRSEFGTLEQSVLHEDINVTDDD